MNGRLFFDVFLRKKFMSVLKSCFETEDLKFKQK